MEARLKCAAIAAALLSTGAGYRTQNFVVDAPTPQLAQQIGQAAEHFRQELAIEWLGEAMPQWAQPCMLKASVSPQLGAGGATSFVFEDGEVFGWQMTVQGSRERILDSVLPHEITHTVFACHFRQALPRWADEGACTTVEHPSEKQKQQRMLIQFLKTGRGIAFSKMFRMKDYPADIMPLYAQGYSLARFLISQGGKQTYLTFLRDGMQGEQWTEAVRQHYGFGSLRQLQDHWLRWVQQGSPLPVPGTLIAQRDDPAPNAPKAEPIYRGQSPDAEPRPARLAGVEQPGQESSRPSQAPAGKWRTAGQGRTSDGAVAGSHPSRPASGPPSVTSPRRQLSRPQPPGGPGQIILQWDKQAPTAAGSQQPRQSAPAARVAGGPVSQRR